MPTKTKTKTRRRRTTARRKRKTYSQMTLIKNPSIGGFPKSAFTRLKYIYNGSLNVGAAGLNTVQVFRANSPYDPDQTGVGAQPRGFDQWMTLYDHFFVKRSKIIVDFHNGDATYEVQCGIAVRDDTPTEAVALEYAEQDAVYTMLGRVGSSHNHKRLTKYFSFSKDNYAKYTSSENKGSASSNPSEISYFHVYAGSPWGQDATNTYFTATIYYDCLFTELKDLNQS